MWGMDQYWVSTLTYFRLREEFVQLGRLLAARDRLGVGHWRTSRRYMLCEWRWRDGHTTAPDSFFVCHDTPRLMKVSDFGVSQKPCARPPYSIRNPGGERPSNIYPTRLSVLLDI
jgi:hypothetical protein